MIYQVFWNSKTDRRSKCGYVEAKNHNEAFDIAQSNLQPGYRVFAVYESSMNAITPQALTINFPNTSSYFAEYYMN